MKRHELHFLGSHDAHRAYLYIQQNVTQNVKKSDGKVIFYTTEWLTYVTQCCILGHINSYNTKFNIQD
jgi:hypothetical protein